jgi:hypothetical protein
MIDQYPEHQLAVHQHRAAELMRAVETERLAQRSGAKRTGLHQQVLARAGDWLIAAGTTLKGRVDPPANLPRIRGRY